MTPLQRTEYIRHIQNLRKMLVSIGSPIISGPHRMEDILTRPRRNGNTADLISLGLLCSDAALTHVKMMKHATLDKLHELTFFDLRNYVTALEYSLWFVLPLHSEISPPSDTRLFLLKPYISTGPDTKERDTYVKNLSIRTAKKFLILSINNVSSDIHSEDIKSFEEKISARIRLGQVPKFLYSEFWKELLEQNPPEHIETFCKCMLGELPRSTLLTVNFTDSEVTSFLNRLTRHSLGSDLENVCYDMMGAFSEAPSIPMLGYPLSEVPDLIRTIEFIIHYDAGDLRLTSLIDKVKEEWTKLPIISNYAWYTALKAITPEVH